MREEKFYLMVTSAFIALTAFGGAYLISQTGQPSGSDINLHLRLATGWLKGDLPTFDERYFNNYPYPPAFQLSIASASRLFSTTPIMIAKLLEIILYPLVFLSTSYFAYKKGNAFIATASILLLGTSPAFWDRASQVIPQAVDLALFPLAAYFFLEKKDTPFLALAVFMIYNHSMYGALPILSLFIYSLKYQKRSLGIFLKILILTIPLILITLAHLEGVISESRTINEEQEDAVLREPLFSIKYLGYPLFFLLIITAIHLSFEGVSDIENLLLIWGLSLLPMILYFPDRLIQYATQPFAILGAMTIDDLLKDKKSRYILVLVLFIFALLLQFNLITTLVRNGEVLISLTTLSPFVI